MTTLKKYTLPTGYLFTDQYSKGELETLSIGDYGKGHNVKADFLGYTNEINGVPNISCMPLSEKWVITLSTQYGCAMKCKFCACPKIKMKGNASLNDLYQQFTTAISMFPDVSYTERMNIHFARMGEPIFNDNVFTFAIELIQKKKQLQDIFNLRTEVIHPVLTTSLPKNFKKLGDKLFEWCDIKNINYNGQAGLQLSINSTCDEQRDDMFNGMSCNIKTISEVCKTLPDPIGRKYCLNFALADGYIVDHFKLLSLFDPNKFMVKITPIHNNNECKENGIITHKGYESYTPYKEVEEKLKSVGFDVLVFIPSTDEENSLVTCGNAVLSGRIPKPYVLSPMIPKI